MLLFNAQIFHYKHIWCLPFCMHAFNILRNTLELAEAQNWQREPNTYRSVNVPSEKAFGNTGHVRCVCIHDECVRAWVRNIFITVRRLCTVAVIELDHFHSYLFSSHFITYTNSRISKTHSLTANEWMSALYNHSLRSTVRICEWNGKWTGNCSFISTSTLSSWKYLFWPKRWSSRCVSLSLSLSFSECVLACVRVTKHTNTFNPRFDIASAHTHTEAIYTNKANKFNSYSIHARKPNNRC